MVRKFILEVLVILVIVELSSLQNVNNTTNTALQSQQKTEYLLQKLATIPNNTSFEKTRRRGRRRRKIKKRRSTSSSSGEKYDKRSYEDAGSSLDMSTVESTVESSLPSENGHKWRKWHRQCKPCPSDMMKKWRHPSISWICGQYQDARRSFKSSCMMYYRNCEDGTMFTKVHDHRCSNDTGLDHFLYDYKVILSDDSSDSSSISTDESSSRGHTFESSSED